MYSPSQNVYKIIFGVLLFFSELTSWEFSWAKWVLGYFTFLQKPSGRGLLCAYLGTSNLIPTEPINLCLGIALCVHAVLSLGVCCSDLSPQGTPGVTSPSTNDAAVDHNALLPSGQEQATGAAYQWAKENPEQARKIAGAGLNFAAENPSVVRGAFQ